MGHFDIFQIQDKEQMTNNISVVMEMPSSNIVTINVPGLAFVEILRVVYHSSGIEIYSSPMFADFSHHSFMAFLKDLIPNVNQKDEECVLLMEDLMLVDNAILIRSCRLIFTGRTRHPRCISSGTAQRSKPEPHTTGILQRRYQETHPHRHQPRIHIIHSS